METSTSRMSRASRPDTAKNNQTHKLSDELLRVNTSRSFDDHATYYPSDSSNPSPDKETDLEKGDGSGNNAEYESDAAKEESYRELDEEVEIELEKDPPPDASGGSPPPQGPKEPKDPLLVSWDGPDDPTNPKNWRMRRKWAAAFVVSSFTFISPVSSSMVSPALAVLSKDLGIKTEFEAAMVLSIFVLAYAIGPLFLGPLSEIYGRVIILQLTNLIYLVFNLACGFSKTQAQILIFRFLSGLGGSAPLAIGGGVLGDCFLPEQRGKAIGIYALMPLLGPAIGPIAGGFIAQNTTWRWCFWSTTILDAVIQVFGLLFLQETYAPVLLQRKAARLRKSTGKGYYTEFDNRNRSHRAVLGTALVRPFRMLFTQPIIQAIAIYMAFIYGLMYLMLATFPQLWTLRYGETTQIGSLNYIALGVGFFLGTQIAAPINDRIYRTLKARNNGVGRPEFRIPLMFVGSAMIPVGLFWYGWSAQARIHWIMPDIGSAIFCAGAIVCFQSMQTYIVDSYTRFAASGIAAAVVLRSLAGFGFPLFAQAMYNKLGYGWGNSLLGLLALLLGFPAPFAFWFMGERLRGRSKFASG